MIWISEDSQTAFQMGQEARLAEASKHISIWYHSIHENVQHGDIKIQYVPSEGSVADIMTKELDGPAHIKLAYLMETDFNNQVICAEK